MDSPLWIGIDIAKASLDVAIGPDAPCATYPNTPAGHHRLIHDLRRVAVAGLVLEATGPYHLELVTALQAAGYRPSVLNPQRIHAYRRSTGKRAKNDVTDAVLLARFGTQQQPAPARIATPTEQHLRALVARREDLVGIRTAEKTRLASERSTVLQLSLKTHIAWLTAQIADLEQAIDALIAADPALAHRRAVLLSVPGIGPVISAVLVAYLPELGELTRRQIAAIAGLAPYDADSGQHHGQRHIAGGRPLVRRALYQAVHAVYSRPTALSEHRDRLRDKSNPRKLIVIALARRMIGIVNAMVREDLTWDQTNVAQGLVGPRTTTIAA
jgi:transposase